MNCPFFRLIFICVACKTALSAFIKTNNSARDLIKGILESEKQDNIESFDTEIQIDLPGFSVELNTLEELLRDRREDQSAPNEVGHGAEENNTTANYSQQSLIFRTYSDIYVTYSFMGYINTSGLFYAPNPEINVRASCNHAICEDRRLCYCEFQTTEGADYRTALDCYGLKKCCPNWRFSDSRRGCLISGIWSNLTGDGFDTNLNINYTRQTFTYKYRYGRIITLSFMAYVNFTGFYLAPKPEFRVTTSCGNTICGLLQLCHCKMRMHRSPSGREILRCVAIMRCCSFINMFNTCTSILG